jgi:hypothetical protein
MPRTVFSANGPRRGAWTGVPWRSTGSYNSDSTALLVLRFVSVEVCYEVGEGRLAATFGSQPGLSGKSSL